MSYKYVFGIPFSHIPIIPVTEIVSLNSRWIISPGGTQKFSMLTLKGGNPSSIEGHCIHHNCTEDVAQNKFSPKLMERLNGSEANVHTLKKIQRQSLGEKLVEGLVVCVGVLDSISAVQPLIHSEAAK